jgi:hypothetical protein
MFKKLSRFLPRRNLKNSPLNIPVPKFATIESSRSRAGYIIGALLAAAGAFWAFYFGIIGDQNARQQLSAPGAPEAKGEQTTIRPSDRRPVRTADHTAARQSQPLEDTSEPQHSGTASPIVSEPTETVPKSPPPTQALESTATMQSEQECCEWVGSTTRSDGTHVEGYWRSKPGCVAACPLAVTPEKHVLSNKPAVHVGPRGGRYHYSKNGKKVYEHRK